jgi:hypothetical protein
MKFAIRPIGRHHPRSSSLPHVGIGRTVSSISGTLPGSPFLSVSSTFCDSAWIGVFSASISFLEIGTSHRVPNQGGMVGGDDGHFLYRQKLQGNDGSVRRGVVMVKQPGMFSQKLGAMSSHVFTQSLQNVAVEPGIHSLNCRDQCFALPQLLYRWRYQSVIFGTPPPRIAASVV